MSEFRFECWAVTVGVARMAIRSLRTTECCKERPVFQTIPLGTDTTLEKSVQTIIDKDFKLYLLMDIKARMEVPRGTMVRPV